MSAPARSRSVRQRIELVRRPLEASLQALWGDPDPAGAYLRYLAMMHGVIRASVPLMRAARHRAAELGPSDGVAAGLSVYLTAHIPEELHHDEWLLDDLEVSGVARASVIRTVPPVAVAAMAGAQYYWIHHVHPVALLGYIAVLEGDPPSPDQVDALMARTGLPGGGFRTLRKHALLDPGHREDLDIALDRLPLEEYHESLIGVSALHTVSSLAAAVSEIVGAQPPAARGGVA